MSGKKGKLPVREIAEVCVQRKAGIDSRNRIKVPGEWGSL